MVQEYIYGYDRCAYMYIYLFFLQLGRVYWMNFEAGVMEMVGAEVSILYSTVFFCYFWNKC